MSRLDLANVYDADANRIAEARRSASTIHMGGDIRAAGNQVEGIVRQVIAEKVPSQYRVTHGHILDYCGNVGPQLDVIVCEDLASKPLFQAHDGTEYVLFESVYVFGEVKAAYRAADRPIEEFGRKISTIWESLSRQTPVQHPIMSFMLFADANGFSVEGVERYYREARPENLPDIICLLDTGIVSYARFLLNGYGQPLPVQYHLPPRPTPIEKKMDRWMYARLGEEGARAACALMFLHLTLIQHLQRCPPGIPNLLAYFDLATRVDQYEIFE